MRLFSVLSLTFVDVGFDLIGAGTKLGAHLSWHIHRIDVHAEVCLAALELVEDRLLRVDCLAIVFELSVGFVSIGRFLEFEFLEGTATFLLLMLILVLLFILAIFICRGGLLIGLVVVAGSQFTGQYVVNGAHLGLLHRSVYLGLLLIIDLGSCTLDVYGRDLLFTRIVFILVECHCRFCREGCYGRWHSCCGCCCGVAAVCSFINIHYGFVAVHEDLRFRCL